MTIFKSISNRFVDRIVSVMASRSEENCTAPRMIVTCAGKQTRWGNYLDTPKHLLKIHGERLLDRTVRLIRRFATDASVAIMALDDAHAAAYDVAGTERFCPVDDMADADALERHYASPHFMACRARWNAAGRTVVVLGDVFFTERAMQTICSDTTRGVRFYGREKASTITGTPWGELFAISFYPDDHGPIVNASDELRERCETVRGWQLYRHLNDLPLDAFPNVIADNDRFVEINDFTDDFDFPNDYDTWITRCDIARRKQNAARRKQSYLFFLMHH